MAERERERILIRELSMVGMERHKALLLCMEISLARAQILDANKIQATVTFFLVKVREG